MLVLLAELRTDETILYLISFSILFFLDGGWNLASDVNPLPVKMTSFQKLFILILHQRDWMLTRFLHGFLSKKD